MHYTDWLVLGITLLFIVVYGTWKSRGKSTVKGFLRGDNEAQWWTVGLSVMATQASAITFLSTPGQAFHDGLGFVQFYFGLPIAMVIICATFIPIYYRLQVYTAYEYLESRFDLKTRTLTAILFLVQRGLAAGITIFAPAIVLSAVLGWNLKLLNLVIGTLVIIYTVSGGTKAVNVTQKQQMFVIMTGMFAALFIILGNFPEEISFSHALNIAGNADKMNALDFSFDLENRYTLWSGLIGGTFLALSYFGTDQSQVQRYLSARSVKEARIGLIFNGLLKVPMQFFILFVGVMVFVFFQFERTPLNFNPAAEQAVKASALSEDYKSVTQQQAVLFDKKQELHQAWLQTTDLEQKTQLKQELKALEIQEKTHRAEAKAIIESIDEDVETNDKDYVFIYFILNYLPRGLIGLLLAVIISAAMSSTAGELNALASTTTIDLYKRHIKSPKSDAHFVMMTKWFTLIWGVIAVLFASFGSLVENLIQLVNIIGSIFYGTVLGIFLVAFYIKHVGAKAIFLAACISQGLVFILFGLDVMPFLWLNFVGAAATSVFAVILQKIYKQTPKKI